MRKLKEARREHDSDVGCATVVIPALNEAARISDVVRYALSEPATAEVIVIDDSSTDDTAALAARAGASVITSSMLGKGASMKDGLQRAECELIVYLDGDLNGLEPGVVSQLVQPLVLDSADFVKARFGRLGGRVTELTAKPMLQVFFPELARFAQPLGGLVAARKSLLEQLSFETGYGVDVALLIDAWRAGARLAEVDIGRLEHDSQPLVDLAAMANEVSRVIHNRAKSCGRLNVDQIGAMYEVQRQATASLDYILTRRRSRSKVLLLDMDGTVSSDRYVVQLARELRCEAALDALLDVGADDAITRSQRIAALFKFVHREKFEKIAHSLPLRSGVVAWVNRMRRRGFMVGLVSDSYFVAAEIVRRRIFADFALAHTLQFNGDVCTGEIKLNPAFSPPESPGESEICKRHVVQRLRQDGRDPAIECIWAVGDNVNDIGMLKAADRAWVISPKSPSVHMETGAAVVASFEALAALTA
jgi:glucosyl-3-phosphoglycerate synthase